MNQPKTHHLGIISSLCGSCLNQRNFECSIAESTAAHVQSYQTNTPAFLKILNTIVLGFQIIFLPYILCHKHTTWIGEYGKMEIHRKMLSIYVNRLYISILSSGPLFNIKMPSYQYGKCHSEIRRSLDRLISTMGFAILVRWHLYIDLAPW